MGGRDARLRCPDAIVVEPRMSAYSAASKAVFEVFRDTTPVVEGLSIDEAFLDVGGLRRLVGSPESIATRLRQRVRDEVGLPITVGVAGTKYLAKVASQVAKPDGLLVVPVGTELEFLHPLPVRLLWGVGPVTAAKLNERGIRTIGQVARLGEAGLVSIVGQHAGRHLHSLAHNRDPRSVVVGRRRGSIGAQRALGRRNRSAAELDALLAGLVDRITGRLRAANRPGRTVTLRLRFADFTRATRSLTVPRETTATHEILSVARSLLAEAQPLIVVRGLTLIGISVGNLSQNDFVQLELPFERVDRRVLDSTLDAVRVRFGSRSVTRGDLVGKDPGLEMPMLPD
jgi:DNA polymerase-4